MYIYIPHKMCNFSLYVCQMLIQEKNNSYYMTYTPKNIKRKTFLFVIHGIISLRICGVILEMLITWLSSSPDIQLIAGPFLETETSILLVISVFRLQYVSLRDNGKDVWLVITGYIYIYIYGKLLDLFAYLFCGVLVEA